MNFIIFPNQLFYNKIDIIKKYKKVYIIEEPIYFNDQKYRQRIFPHKLKIAYMVACMRVFYDFLKKYDINIDYIEYNDIYKTLKNIDKFDTFNPYDKDIEDKYKSKINIIDSSPYFTMTDQQLEKYYIENKYKNNISHAHFFNYVKNTLNILKNTKSYDKYNRKSIPDNLKFPKIIKFKSNKYYESAIKYVESHKIFSKHYGILELNNLILYPINRVDSIKNLNYFIKNKLKLFGKYQDAIKEKHHLLYHSNISSSLNNGLINPKDILNIIFKYDKKYKIPINSLEGFLRQVFGWREYCRYLYKYYYNDLIKSNNFNANKTISDEWYNGTTNIYPIDNEIRKVIKYSYSHHIIRLMLFLNYFILTGKSINEIYIWFMNMISIDAYDWVMRPNISIMSHYWVKATKRPYISSSNYILKMSDYKCNDWCKIWNEKFYNFIKKNKNNLYGTAKIYLRNLNKS